VIDLFMKTFATLIASMGLFALFNHAASGAEALKAGDPAPDFSLPGSDGKTYKLSDFKGKRAVVIGWFPKAFTGG
jgi:peroxiredoxin Q/BCP